MADNFLESLEVKKLGERSLGVWGLGTLPRRKHAKTKGFLIGFYGFSMVFLWFFQWFFYGFFNGFQGCLVGLDSVWLVSSFSF